MLRLNDKNFVRLLASGDQEAFNMMVRISYPVLRKAALHILVDGDEAAEVIQETYITVWTKRGEFLKVDNLANFLFIMMRNRALHHLRRRRRDEEFRSRHRDQSYARSPDQLLEDVEYRKCMHYTLSALPYRQREVFMMSRESNMSHKEIARVLNISVHTVHNHMKAALMRFRSMLAEYNAEP